MRMMFLCLLLVALAAAAPQKQPRAFSVFEIKRWSNDVCTATAGQEGTCYTESECLDKGGLADGTCADNFGVCCIFTVDTCGTSTSTNNTYFTQPATLVTGDCALEICPVSADVRQIRLDLQVFTLDGPDMSAALPYPAVAGVGTPDIMTLPDSSAGWTSQTNTHGQCNLDSMTVTSSGIAPPVICGENAGQHMYVEVDGVTCVTLNIKLTTPLSQLWTVKIAQIETGVSWEAPTGCLQYHMGDSGSFQSFNFANSVHLADQSYDICMRREANMCKIGYTASTFQISAVGYTNNFGAGNGKCNIVDLLPSDLTLPQDNLQLGNDWVHIYAGSDTLGSPTYDRFCGLQLHANDQSTSNTEVSSTKIPFRVGVNFDSTEATGTNAELGLDDTSSVGDADRGDVGFDIAFQQAC